MPIYGYECTGCQAEFETMQSIKDDPLTTCDSCGGTLRKKIYPVGIAFKGSGFYVNDYASSGGKADAGEKSAPAAEPKAAEPKPAESGKPDAAKSEAPKPQAAKEAAPAAA